MIVLPYFCYVILSAFYKGFSTGVYDCAGFATLNALIFSSAKVLLPWQSEARRL
jgi:hypothetical protein